MKVIYNLNTDPYFNLAAEEFLLKHTQDEYFMLWRNSPCVVVGRNQNTFAEINFDYIRKKNLPVVRRLTGGGAVFHDLGNLNYTFIERDSGNSFSNYSKFCAPVIETLRELGIPAELSGRNDLVINGLKFSGNAQCLWKKRIMHHGTLMFSADVSDMTQALNVNPLKIRSKGIKSVRSRVTNISQHRNEPLDINDFALMILKKISGADSGQNTFTFSEDEVKQIEILKSEKYSLWDWNFGFEKEYSIKKETALPFGFFDVKINVCENKIESIRFFGDYFGKKDVSELESLLAGIEYEPGAILKRVENLPLGDYFSGISTEELIQIII